MRKTSKFSFPIPGRKGLQYEDSSAWSTSNPPRNPSKAQRLLGPESDLNIDSPGLYKSDDEPQWNHPGSRSSYMSIAVSESVNTTSDELESRLRGKASSTLLGNQFGDDGLSSSNLSDRLRKEDSSSTLKSFYDRNKSPLAISQQTSDSAVRDLALRKGLPRVVPASPLLAIEPSEESYHTTSGNGRTDRGNRRKPARLDFSLLVPKSVRRGEKAQSEIPSPSSASTIASRTPGLSHPDSARRKIVKILSRDSLKSPSRATRGVPSNVPIGPQSHHSLAQLYDHYEQLPLRTPPSNPETRPPSSESEADHPASQKLDQEEKIEIQETRSDEKRYDVPLNGNVPRKQKERPKAFQEMSSDSSITSRVTKTSRHSSISALSQADLREKSILSLSSDSEEDDVELSPMACSVANEKALLVMTGALEDLNETKRKLTHIVTTMGPKSPVQRKGAAQETPFLTIPELPSNPRLSGPWSPPRTTSKRPLSRSSLPNGRSPTGQAEIQSIRTASSVGSVRTGRDGSQQPTPPLSPTSMEFRQSSEFSSRFMAVTRQEEALLAALRQKKARMKERIIEEHESIRPGPQIPTRRSSRYSVATSVDTATDSGSTSDKHRILLYLDTPLPAHHEIDAAEPSPDLSDFLSFGSDEYSTPRTSYVGPRRGAPRPDSTVSTSSPQAKRLQLPGTPPSAKGLRISAVGPSSAFLQEGKVAMVTGHRSSGVAFVDDVHGGNPDFMLESHEREPIWGLH